MMLVKFPDANEKKKTPRIMRNELIIRSKLLCPEISPYPTVDIVVIVK